MRIDSDGIRIGSGFLLAAVVSVQGYVLSGNAAFIWTAGAIAALFFYVLFFFRDPERAASETGVVSAADGVVMDIAQVPAEGFESGEALRIAVFMNVFNVHINRSPADGTVLKTVHKPGKKISAMNPRAAYENEYGDTDIKTVFGIVRVRQIAGLIARRVVSRVREGDALKRGQRIGLIRFGSRVDVFLPVSFVPAVRRGERVRAGESIIARIAGS